MDEVKRTIISRVTLKEHGYDGDNISDEDLEYIADMLVQNSDMHWHLGEMLRIIMEQITK